MMTSRHDVGRDFEDPKSALQIGFRGHKKRNDCCLGHDIVITFLKNC